ncbi:hypothetical protein FRC00_012862, partial [Tulasnella sp. 408]
MATAPPLQPDPTHLNNTADPLSNRKKKLPRDIYAYAGQRILEDHLVKKLPVQGGRPIPILTTASA